MDTPLSKIATSLRQLGEIQVSELDFIGLLNKDIADLEVRRSLARLGSIKVTDWDFRSILPKVKELGAREIDVVDLVKRTAAYRVMEWDFRSSPASPSPSSTSNLLQPLITSLTSFLQFIVSELTTRPSAATIEVKTLAPGVLQFAVAVPRKDLTQLIGIQGQTAAAIRNLMKAAAAEYSAHVLLQITDQDTPPSRNSF